MTEQPVKFQFSTMKPLTSSIHLLFTSLCKFITGEFNSMFSLVKITEIYFKWMRIEMAGYTSITACSFWLTKYMHNFPISPIPHCYRPFWSASFLSFIQVDMTFRNNWEHSFYSIPSTVWFFMKPSTFIADIWWLCKYIICRDDGRKFTPTRFHNW